MHDHKYNGRLVLKRITAIDNKQYQGDPGDKAFIYRYCSHEGCESQETWDYGRYTTLKKRYDTIAGQTVQEVPAKETA